MARKPLSIAFEEIAADKIVPERIEHVDLDEAEVELDLVEVDGDPAE